MQKRLAMPRPKDFQALRRQLRPRIRALRDYVSETVRCSPAFYAAVLAGIHSVPDDFHELLHRQGRRIQIGDRLIHMDPSLKGQQPRGWPAGSTWAELGGAYQGAPDNRVLLAETIEETGQLLPTPFMDATCREELGHALDEALDQGAGPASHTHAAFLSAYLAEAAAITDPVLRSAFDYLLQPGIAGQEEAFASLFALVYGGAVGTPAFQQLLRQAFPRTLQVVRSISPP
jgi:hypothetical protein